MPADTRNWHHYALVFRDDGETALYVDAAFVEDFTVFRTGDVVVSILMSTLSADDFAGPFCGVRIYDTTRTQPQIQADKEIGLPAASGGKLIKILLLGSLDRRAAYQRQHFDTYGVYALAP